MVKVLKKNLNGPLFCAIGLDQPCTGPSANQRIVDQDGQALVELNARLGEL